MAQVNYVITKISEDNGVSTYEVKYTFAADTQVLLQKEELILSKEDASGEVVENKLEVPANSIVSYNLPSSQTPTKAKKDGFAINVSDSNLAAGGVYYDVESTSGTYVKPGQSSSVPQFNFYIAPRW